MSKLLGIPGTLDLLERLRQNVQKFARQEDALRQTLDSRVAGETRTFQASVQARSEQLSEALTAIETEFAASAQGSQAHFDQRQRRIAAAYKACRKQTLDSIQEQESRHRYTLQKRTLEAERQRETAIAQAGDGLQQFRQELAASQDRFADLERAVHQAFAGVREFKALLVPERTCPAVEPAGDEHQLLGELARIGQATEEAIRRFRRTILGGVMRVFPVWLLVVLLCVAYGAALYALPRYVAQTISSRALSLGFAGCILLLLAVYFGAKTLSRKTALAIAQNLGTARHWHENAWAKAQTRERDDKQTAQTRYEDTLRQLEAHWEQARAEADRLRSTLPPEIDARQQRAQAKSAELLARAQQQLIANREHKTAALQNDAAAAHEKAERASQAHLQALQVTYEQGLASLEAQWRESIGPIYRDVAEANRAGTELTRPWDDPLWAQWQPGATFPPALPFGEIQVNVEELAGVKFGQRRLQLPGPLLFNLPLLLRYPELGSLLLETASTGSEAAIGVMNAAIFRLLALAPPASLNLTLFDPAGLGQNFASLMHLADFEVNQINSRIWTQTSQLEEKLTELNEHMEKVIQMYLRNEYPSLAEFNAHAGKLAEKYHFLVIAGFPVNFSETAGRRLLNIALSGARCGVYLLIQWDRRRDLPHDFIPDELRKHAVRVVAESQKITIPGFPDAGVKVQLAAPPSPDWATDFLRRVGELTRAAGRVELDFSEIAPPPGERWTRQAVDEFRIPIGRSGATKLQELALGKGTRQHALVSGKTGSGKSTLFHVIITNTGLTYSPDEVEFYLVDFKKGVEFKPYATRHLPHARVIAIESDREFGLSVLQRLDEELRRRGELFRKAGVQDLPGYRQSAGRPVLSRLLLLIDEFQEFFTEEDRISQSAAVLLDRIVRQGRAFGIHVILGSQTLGGAYTLARATIGQMVVRIALQCNEADAFLIMDENNAAPRLLSRPGEGIYNDQAGAAEANSPFQTAWLPDETRDRLLAEIQRHAAQQWPDRPLPIVFEGNAPADPSENAELARARQRRPTQPPQAALVWLGAPNAIKGPTAAVFESQSGSNLLVVGQNETAVVGLPALALISLAAQFPADAVRLVLVESAAPGSAERTFFDQLLGRLPVAVLRPKRSELPDLVRRLAEELPQAGDEGSTLPSVTTFLVISNLQELKTLRQEDEFSLEPSAAPSAAAAFATLLTEGPSNGCHVIATIDTYGNVARCLGRKLLGQFQWRVLFQMSASDSASLIDEPEASRLGLHRALLFNEREGYIEKFRPYAIVEQLTELLSEPTPERHLTS